MNTILNYWDRSGRIRRKELSQKNTFNHTQSSESCESQEEKRPSWPNIDIAMIIFNGDSSSNFVYASDLTVLCRPEEL